MAAKRKQLSSGTVATRRATPLLDELRGLILAAREQVARTVDSGLNALRWHVGRRFHQDILHGDQAAYGQEIVSALRRELTKSHFKRLIARNMTRAAFGPDRSRINRICPSSSKRPTPSQASRLWLGMNTRNNARPREHQTLGDQIGLRTGSPACTSG